VGRYSHFRRGQREAWRENLGSLRADTANKKVRPLDGGGGIQKKGKKRKTVKAGDLKKTQETSGAPANSRVG